MTRQPSPSRETPSSWVGFKDLARRQYERGDYEGALASYTAALNPDLQCPRDEQIILLSNLVACRLKIGGPAQARAAVDNAKKCVELNPEWAKGHVRLASAYIALGGHSNDACNELQRALSIDPGNSTAREMLLRELRRDHSAASAARNTNNNNSSTSATTPERESTRSEFDEPPSYPPPPPPPYDDAVDESLTWSEWVQFHFSKVTSWYNNQSDDVKTVCKILMVLLVLYVGFGGRFGFEGTRQSGNYGSNNVYDQYRRYGTTQSSSYGTTQSSYPYNSRDNNDRGRRTTSRQQRDSYYQDNPYDDNYSYGYNRQGGGGWGSGFNSGSLPGMLMLGGIMFAGHRMGINPFQTMMFVNLMQGGRRRFRPRGGFGMGGGMGMGGFGHRRGMGGYGRRRF